MWALIDCNALCYRAAFGMFGQELEHDMIRTEVIYNFLSQIKNAALKFNTRDFAFCWDSLKSDRRDTYPTYKGSRKKKRKDDPEKKIIWEETYKQMSLLRSNVLPEMGFVNNFVQTGKEADDLIAVICRDYPGEEKIIMSNDNDLFQLLSPSTIMWYYTNEKGYFREQDFIAKYGITPDRWAEAKSIGGCDGDDVTGVLGFADPKKPASRVYKYFKDELPATGVLYNRVTSEEGKKKIALNRRLVELPMEGTESVNLCRHPHSSTKFADLFRKLGFDSFFQDWESWEEAFDLREEE